MSVQFFFKRLFLLGTFQSPTFARKDTSHFFYLEEKIGKAIGNLTSMNTKGMSTV